MPPIVGAIALVGGIVLLVVGRKKAEQISKSTTTIPPDTVTIIERCSMRSNHHKNTCRHISDYFIQCLVLGVAIAFLSVLPGPSFAAEVQVIALGDSLTQGTMDATNNARTR